MILKARRELPRHVWKPASRSRRAVRRSFGVRRVSEHGGSYPAGVPEKERRAPAPRRAAPGASSGHSYWLGRSDARTSCVRASKNLCSLSLLRDCSARLRPAAAGSRRVGGRSGSQPSLHLPSTCARGPFAARLDARATEELRSDSQVGPAYVPVQRPTVRPTDGAECARVLCRWCGGEGADAARRAAQPAPNVVPRPAA